MIDRSGLTGEKGTIHLAISASEPTLDYLKDGEPVGSEVDIITHFCTEYGYDLQVDTLDYTAMTPAITACKYDIAAAASVPLYVRLCVQGRSPGNCRAGI